MFDLSLDYEDDEDLLLDWRPPTRLGFCNCILPEWWYRLLPRQRKVPAENICDSIALATCEGSGAERVLSLIGI